jgi:PilZ domain-containing protein
MRRWRRKLSGAMCIVDFNDGTGGHGCRLVNFSNGGARLSGFVHASAIPEFVALLIRDRQILKRDCKVVWRGSRDVGVQFTNPPTPMKLGQIAWQLKQAQCPRLGA